ncbi:MAG: hypothetical protein ACKOAS_09815 [Verrucomicrobiota bacterium]
MKTRAILLAASLLAIGLHTGCERHSASQTIPGYAEKMKEKEKKKEQAVEHSEAVDPNAPTYFPPKQN